MDGSEKIVLGSGKLYMAEYDETAGIPEATVLEVDDNRLGDIQGGATLTYTPTFYDVSDDLGLAKKTFLTKEDVTLTSGILTFNVATLNKLVETGTVEEDTATNTRTLKIGGISKFTGKAYVIRFVQIDGTKVTIIGSSKTALSLAYLPDKETVINAEFIASAQDADGTLVTISETTA